MYPIAGSRASGRTAECIHDHPRATLGSRGTSRRAPSPPPDDARFPGPERRRPGLRRPSRAHRGRRDRARLTPAPGGPGGRVRRLADAGARGAAASSPPRGSSTSSPTAARASPPQPTSSSARATRPAWSSSRAPPASRLTARSRLPIEAHERGDPRRGEGGPLVRASSSRQTARSTSRSSRGPATPSSSPSWSMSGSAGSARPSTQARLDPNGLRADSAAHSLIATRSRPAKPGEAERLTRGHLERAMELLFASEASSRGGGRALADLQRAAGPSRSRARSRRPRGRSR